MISWKDLETNVKALSSFIWNCDARNETINGVKFDCVLKPKQDHWMIVEITEDESLQKVRTDIAKLATCRHFLFSQDIYPEVFLVMRNEPTESMITTGAGNKVKVLSYISFSKLFLDYSSYSFIRKQKVFGSSVNPFSGDIDTIDYTPVHYQNTRTQNDIDLKEIARLLLDGRRVVTLGNYGTGKSRLIRELFFHLINKTSNKMIYPIAINLKEHLGTQTADELLFRHFSMLGLSHMTQSILKILESDNFIFLLDGFDEIASQVWSNDTSKLQQIRASSLSAVKDLIIRTKSPIIITGREHYFNSDKEMLNVLGLKNSETELLRCKDEFTEDEMTNYLKNISLAVELPIWLPRRPLICQIINNIPKEEIDRIFIDSYSSIEFWNTLIKNICEREARIATVLQHENIFKILKEISNVTRFKENNVGPITVREINQSFEKVIGIAPIDNSTVMLQRLPALGRISAQNMDRQFIDFYILDGLRAEDLIDIVYENKVSVVEEEWFNPLGKIGIEIVAKKMLDDKSANIFIEFLKKSIYQINKVLAGDILSSLVYFAKKNTLDLGGIIVQNSKIASINFSKSLIENFSIQDSFIDEIDISNLCFSRVIIKDCFITKIYGISSESEIPSCLIDCKIDSFIPKPMDSDNKLFGLTPSQMIFISIIKKTFFLGGANKSEHEIISGFGNKENRTLATNILKLLVREKIFSKPDVDNRYSPKTFNRGRMKAIISDLNKSKDPLWKLVGEI